MAQSKVLHKMINFCKRSLLENLRMINRWIHLLQIRPLSDEWSCQNRQAQWNLTKHLWPGLFTIYSFSVIIKDDCEIENARERHNQESQPPATGHHQKYAQILQKWKENIARDSILLGVDEFLNFSAVLDELFTVRCVCPQKKYLVSPMAHVLDVADSCIYYCIENIYLL